MRTKKGKKGGGTDPNTQSDHPEENELPRIREVEENPDVPVEATTVTTLLETSSVRAPGQLVPILQMASGAESGKMISLMQYRSVTIGRDKECELSIFDQSCSRRHAEITVNELGKSYIKDLGSTNGTKINGIKLKSNESTPLEDGTRIQLGENTILRFSLLPEEEAKIQMEVYFRATRDALTNAFNRHQFYEALDRELAYQKRAGMGLALIFFDVDHFKKVNDTFGHPAGDEVLREIGARVPTCIRIEDIFARLGGEEFGVLLRAENLEGLKILAERIRQAMERKDVIADGQRIQFTISVGCSYVAGKTQITASHFVKMADEALYQAKNSGRNRTVIRVPKNK